MSFVNARTNGLLSSNTTPTTTNTIQLAAASSSRSANNGISVATVHVDNMDIDESESPDDPAARGPIASSSRLAVDTSMQRATSEPLGSIPLKQPQFRVGIVYSDAMLMHAPANDHPEMPNRISGIYLKLLHNKLISFMKRVPIRQVKKMEALLVHSEDHWYKVEAIQRELL